MSVYITIREVTALRTLTVGQFREALGKDRPVLHVKAEQDKIRFEHYVPLTNAWWRLFVPFSMGEKMQGLCSARFVLEVGISAENSNVAVQGHFVRGSEEVCYTIWQRRYPLG